MKSPIDLLRNLLIDFKRLESSVNGLDRDIITIECRFKHEGYSFLTVTLPILGKALQQGLSLGRFSCPLNFKRVKGGTIPLLFKGMFSEVFDPLTGLVRQDLNYGTLKNLYQVLFLFKKTQLTDESNDKLDKAAKLEFFECDEKCLTEMPDRESHYIRRITPFILNSLRLNSELEIRCKHGPGAVMEGLKANQKWSAVLDGIFKNLFEIGLYGYDLVAFDANPFLSEGLAGNEYDPIDLQAQYRGSSRNSARLVSVPKDSTKNRTITVEPVLNQFVQQGLNEVLRDSITRCSILNRSLALTDQSKNQHLALVGSRTDRWATLDLKSASDLMSLSLVKLIFGTHPLFLRNAIDCRTPFIQTGITVRGLSKFAGMGNALTFPVQSVVFAVIAISSIMDKLRLRVTRKNLERVSRHVRVYGDDIIISREHAHCVVHWLELFGLKTNPSKSFLVGNFKESCGVDAYKGVDITPIYVKPRPDGSSADPSDISSLVSLANQLWLEGLYKAAESIENEVESRLGKRLPLVSKCSQALGWHSRRDTSHIHSWCGKRHTWLVKAPVALPIRRKDKLDGYAALLKCFHVPLIGRPRKHLEETSVRFQLKTAWKRVPVRLTAAGKVHFDSEVELAREGSLLSTITGILHS